LQITTTPILTASPETTAETCCQSPHKPTAFVPVLPDPLEFNFGLTYHRPDGNRLVAGYGDLQNAEIIDIPLPGTPMWVVAAPYNSGSLWVVVLTDGGVTAFYVENGTARSFEIQPQTLPSGMPPILIYSAESASLMTNPISNDLGVTHPIWNAATKSQILISVLNEVVLWDSGVQDKLAGEALPDARILQDESGRILLLSQPTNQYGHGVLGDSIEAAGFTLVESNDELRVVTAGTVDQSAVIEGIVPIWSDLNGDNIREIIVTESDANQGARIVAYAETGIPIAVGPAIGQGYRWRHQLAVAPFGPAGELELAVVRTPHIGGILEFYQMRGNQLEIVATLSGFSTHSIGSRNLDNALAGDFDGDGIIELLLPDQAHENLGAVHRTDSGVEVEWWLPLAGKHTSNLAAVTLPDGQITVGIGTENNILRIWNSQEDK